MKLCVHVNVLLLALGVISGQKCNESNECDSNSHLHVATKVAKVAKAAIQISEFQPGSPPTPPGPPVPGFPLVELSGPPGDSQVCVWSINTDGGNPQLFVDSVAPPTGIPTTVSFDPITGLAEVPGPELAFPSFAIVLSFGCPPVGYPVDQSFLAAILPNILPIHDSIWVPNAATATELQDVLNDIRAAVAAATFAPDTVPGSVLPYNGASPSLVFREGSTGPLFQVVNGAIFDADGNSVDPGDFDSPSPDQPTPDLINPSLVSGATGDPHIHTLDGGHYTLLREGSFLLWRFGLLQPHVEWQIFAHYAGRQSFTKGLLLVDTSGPEPSSMEITSERCEWQTQSSSKKWSSVNSTLPEVLLSGPSSHMKLVGNQRKDMKKIQLFIADETVPVATLKVICRQGRHINMKLYMGNQKWKPFVSGELKGQKDQTVQKDMPTSKSSMLELAGREDQEFEVTKTWAELGGSSHAQQYLQNFDAHQNLAFIQMCDPQAQADARALCQKHLGTVARSSYFEECVYDVCSGAGEVAAEMAAEMLKF